MLEQHASARLGIFRNRMIDLPDYMMPTSLGFLVYGIDIIIVVVSVCITVMRNQDLIA